MLFKNAFEENQGLRFVYEHLQLSSSLGRSYLLDYPLINNKEELLLEFDYLSRTKLLLENADYKLQINHIRQQLHQVNNIRPTLALLDQEVVLDDIQLFEIKKTALLTKGISADLSKFSDALFVFDDMDAVIALLDPERTNIPHFYIYAAYDPDLAEWRHKIQLAENQNDAEQFREKAQQIEDRIRKQLTDTLKKYRIVLIQNIRKLAHLDLLLAKAQMAINWHCCCPEISESTDLQRLFNPEVAEALALKGRSFQPVDIRFGQETILITGANMAGKSVLLKTVSLAQFMFQFGFFVPAEQAKMTIVENILCSIGDRQSEISGLSSFAVEILTIDKIIREAKSGKKILALVDELARTTNPEEGKHLVNGFIRIMDKYHVSALVTTHYSGISAPCRRLRVKGLQLQESQNITAGNISDFMDYSLTETNLDEVPMEALTIAKLFGVDEEFLENCQ